MKSVFLASMIVLLLTASRGECSSNDTGMNVILVTWDGVRPLEFQGRTDARVSGEPARDIMQEFWLNLGQRGRVFGTRHDGKLMVAGNLQFMSLPGYQSIAAGSPQPCDSNQCGRIQSPTFLENVARSHHLPMHQVATIASWRGIADAAESGDGATFVNAGNVPLDDGQNSEEAADINSRQLQDPPAWPEARRDVYTQAHAMRYLLAHKPRFLWIGLNDSDEWAHAGNYGNYIATLETYAHWLKELSDVVDTHPSYANRTCVFVTTDHSRGNGKDWTRHSNGLPSSGLIWLFSYCNLKTPLLIRPALVDQRVYSHLDIRPTVEKIFGLNPKSCMLCGRPIDELIPVTFPVR